MFSQGHLEFQEGGLQVDPFIYMIWIFENLNISCTF